MRAVLIASRDRWRIRKILGRAARIGALSELRHPGTGRLVLFECEDAGGKLVLKSYRRSRKVEAEARNLRVIARAPQLRAPRYVGRHARHLIYEYIEGEPLDSALRAMPHARLQCVAQRAIESLIAIHSAAGVVRDADRLDDPFHASRLESWLQSARDVISSRGLPAYAEATGADCARWANLLPDALVATLVKDLQSTAEQRVLGHGDYHGSNLLLTPQGEVCAIDWQFMSWATPWYDLAYPTALLGSERRPELAARYLEQMQARGKLLGISPLRARELSRSGALYQKVVLARANVAKAGARNREYQIEEFGKALRELAAIAG